MGTTKSDQPNPRGNPSHGRGGSRGSVRGRGGGRNKRQEPSTSSWRTRDDGSKRRRLEDGNDGRPVYAADFSKEEIDAEERKPKKKVAVMIGYSGSGYKGMQLNDKEKTIEGDLFKAFVAAGAISKANGNDPRKSSLVRCARTDKGVHAAGNVISIKLIVEDEDIVRKINDNLSPQIRVWGFERTNNSFSAYQLCDSRIYEYLIPTYCFLPPHPQSYLGKKLLDLADEAGDRVDYESRQEEVAIFWKEVDEQRIDPILERLDVSTRPIALDAIHHGIEEKANDKAPEIVDQAIVEQPESGQLSPTVGSSGIEQAVKTDTVAKPEERASLPLHKTLEQTEPVAIETPVETGTVAKPEEQDTLPLDITLEQTETVAIEVPTEDTQKSRSPLELAILDLRAAYLLAKKSYRISPTRLARVQSAFALFVGTHNFHNYTVHKTFHDPSAKRIIKSIVVSPSPFLINNTEWLSLKVHGQSFMMHQIRKMVAMATLVVRTGCHPGRIQDSYKNVRFIIPKAPGLGLLLERPIFENYNEKVAPLNERAPIGFTKYESEMAEFKQREIYDRIYREEAEVHTFHSMFASVDGYRSEQMLWLSSMGPEAVGRARKQSEAVAADIEGEESDDEVGGAEEG